MDTALSIQTGQIALGEDSGLFSSSCQLPDLLSPSRWAIQIKVSDDLSSEEFICATYSARPTIKHLPMGPKSGGKEAYKNDPVFLVTDSPALPGFLRTCQEKLLTGWKFQEMQNRNQDKPSLNDFYFCLEERNTLLE